MIPRFAAEIRWAPVGLCLLVLWVPVPYGSVTPLGLLLLRAGAFGIAALALLPARRGPSLPVATSALAALGLLGLLQATPLPAAVVGWLSPERLELGRTAGVGEWLPLSLAPSQTLSTALTFLACAAAFATALGLGSARGTRRALLGSIVAGGMFQLLYGFRHLSAGSLSVWGLEVGRDASRLRGTFVNPAHAALYLELGLAVSFALVWWAARRGRSSARPEEWRLAMIVGPVLLWLLMFSGLAFTRSRAGLVAALLGTVCQGVILAAYHRRWRLLPVGLGGALLGVAWVAWAGLERGLGRLLGTSVYDVASSARFEVWRATGELWNHFPLFGTGLGTFETTFPMMMTRSLSTVTWEHAHNDWLELLSTGGVVGIALAAIAFVSLSRRLHSSLMTSHSQEAAAAALAGFGALASVSFHELLDFGLTQPANAVTAAVLLGVAAAGDTDLESSEASG